MNLQAIFHISEIPYAYGVDKDTLFIKIRVASNEVKKVVLHYKDRYNWRGDFISVTMEKASSTTLFDFYEKKVKVSEGRLRYFFEIEGNKGEKVYLNERGVLENEPETLGQFQYPYVHVNELYKNVPWAKESIVYQIFPDRFCNGDNKNDPENIQNWGEEVNSKSFFGGDLRGIINNIDYLSNLGINIIYLTPIFKSTTNHKYNTKDYFEIDEHFGTKEEFKELVTKCHNNGIRVVLDAVFNHTGNDFFAFEDLKKNGKKSKYKDWYFLEEDEVNEDTINYRTFANKLRYMPKLNMSNEETKNYFLDVAAYWIKEFDIDGWRLDVADEVLHTFWKEFRTTVKNVKEDAFIIGEVMHEGKLFLKGDEFDSTMNYPFREACLDFFAYRKIDSKDLIDRVLLRKEGLIREIYSQMLNLLDSHDTARFLTECNDDIKKLILATVFQFTIEGIPYIYYGDEVGINGGEDPNCRRCMIWDNEKQNKNLLKHYKKLIEIRKNNKALVNGKYEELYAKDRALAYKRVLDNNEILVLINNDKEKQNFDLNINGEFSDIYSGEKVLINKSIELEKMSFKIISLK